MATVQHNTLTTTNLHEPKGADAATANQVYISDGAGSGAWTNWPFGWGYYQQSGSGQVINTTASRITINGSGSETNETYLPQAIRGSSSLWDTTNYKILPIAEGDAYMIRLAIPIASKTGGPNIFTVEVDISGASSPTTVISTRDISIAATAPFDIQMAFPIFIGSTALTNGVQFFCSTDSNSVTLGDGAEILINRISSGDI
jgi:hypothetical protein